MNQKNWWKVLRRISLLALVCVLFSSCAALNPDQGRQSPDNTSRRAAKNVFDTGSAAVWNGEKGAFLGWMFGATAKGLPEEQIGPYMDQQEAGLRKVTAGLGNVSLKRQGNSIFIILRGEEYTNVKNYGVIPRMYTELYKIAAVLTNFPKTWIQVGGYADPKGSKAENLRLSKSRADIVANELAKCGINVARIKSVGFGEDTAYSAGDPQKYALDRRVEILLEPMRRAQ